MTAAGKTFLGLLGATFRELREDRDPRMAPALAFYGFFSLAPLFLLTAVVVGQVIDPLQLERQIQPQIARILPADAAGWVVGLLDGAIRNRGTVFSIGVVIAVLGGSGIFLGIQGVLNDIFHVPRIEVVGLVHELRRRVFALTAAVSLGVVVLVVLAANAALQFVYTATGASRWLVPVVGLASSLVSLLLLVTTFAFIFRYMSDIRLPWRAIWRGAVFTGAMFVAAIFAVGWGLANVPRFGTLGAVGAVAIVLTFAYLLGEVFVFGAEFTKVYADYLTHGDIAPPSRRASRRPIPDRPTSAGPARRVRAEVGARADAGHADTG